MEYPIHYFLGPVGPVSVKDVHETIEMILDSSGEHKLISKFGQNEVLLTIHESSRKHPKSYSSGALPAQIPIEYCIRYIPGDQWMKPLSEIYLSVFEVSGKVITPEIVRRAEKELSKVMSVK